MLPNCIVMCKGFSTLLVSGVGFRREKVKRRFFKVFISLISRYSKCCMPMELSLKYVESEKRSSKVAWVDLGVTSAHHYLHQIHLVYFIISWDFTFKTLDLEIFQFINNPWCWPRRVSYPQNPYLLIPLPMKISDSWWELRLLKGKGICQDEETQGFQLPITISHGNRNTEGWNILPHWCISISNASYLVLRVTIDEKLVTMHAALYAFKGLPLLDISTLSPTPPATLGCICTKFSQVMTTMT